MDAEAPRVISIRAVAAEFHAQMERELRAGLERLLGQMPDDPQELRGRLHSVTRGGDEATTYTLDGVPFLVAGPFRVVDDRIWRDVKHLPAPTA